MRLRRWFEFIVVYITLIANCILFFLKLFSFFYVFVDRIFIFILYLSIFFSSKVEELREERSELAKIVREKKKEEEERRANRALHDGADRSANVSSVRSAAAAAASAAGREAQEQKMESRLAMEREEMLRDAVLYAADDLRRMMETKRLWLERTEEVEQEFARRAGVERDHSGLDATPPVSNGTLLPLLPPRVVGSGMHTPF